MKKVSFSFLAILFGCASLFFTSCDKIEEKATVKVELGEVPFDIPLNFEDSKSYQMKRTGVEFVSFSGKSTPISLESDMFKELGNNVGSVVLLVTDVKIKITTTSASGTTVRDFTSSVTGAEIQSYTKGGDINLGENYSDNALTEYMKKIFAAVQNKKEVVVNISGQTDIVSSEIEGATVTVATIIPTLTAEVKLLK